MINPYGKITKKIHSFSIKQKMLLIIMGASIFSLLVVIMFFMAYFVSNSKKVLAQETAVMAKLIADRSNLAVALYDDRLTQENLNSLALRKSVVMACAYDIMGVELARFQRDNSRIFSCPLPLEENIRMDDNNLELFTNIMLSGEKVGTIYVLSDLDEIKLSLVNYASFAVFIIAISVGISYLLSVRMQLLISEPFSRLISAVRDVARRKDYSVRVNKESSDEMGILIDAFNEMLSRIESRDRQLVRTRDAAEASNRAKSEFLANINHELRTPLNAIIGFSEIIKAELLGELGNTKYRQYINDIYTSGVHLLEVINDIIDFSKIEAGQIDITFEEFEARRIIKGCIRMLTPKAEEKSISITDDLPKINVVINSDKKKFKQILLNLLSNSVKFTNPSGHIHIKMEYDDIRKSIKLCVADNGIGIASKDIEKAMTPFGQVDSRLARQYEGTGLGLPLTKKFTEILGGEFSIESEPDVGTKIYISLPSIREEEDF